MRQLLFISLFLPFALFSQTITVLTPNGGENLTGCNLYTISWNESSTSGYFSVEYTLDDGNNWVSLASFLQGGSYSWSLPCSFSNLALVKVYDSNDPSVSDQSDAHFTINPPKLKQTAPAKTSRDPGIFLIMFI